MDNFPSYYLKGSLLSVRIVNSGSIADVSFKVDSAFTPFTMSQVLVVEPDSEGNKIVLKIYDPRFLSHRSQYKHPWDPAAEVQAAHQRLDNAPFDFEHPEWPDREDRVGWEEWYFRRAEKSFSNEIEAYSRLLPLQGGGVPKCFGSGTLNLLGRPISPHVLFLEYLRDVQSLRDIDTKLVTEQIIRALKETVSAFDRLGVAHCDLNYGNILFLVGCGGIYRATIIDFGSSCVRDDESDEEWDAIVEEQSDMMYLEKRLARAFKERP
jgi:serine/threonine protein kinase